MTIGSMYELEAIGELLEQRGVMTKAEIIALAKDLKQKTPPTEPRTATTIDIPSQPRFTDTDNAVIEQIMGVILRHGLSADHATTPLGRTIQLLEGSKEASGEDYRNLQHYLIDELALHDSDACPENSGYWKNRVDYIFYRGGQGARIELSASGSEDQRFRHPVNRGRKTPNEEVKYEDLLSDHPAIRAEFNILPSQLPPNSPWNMERGSCVDEKLPED